MLMLKHIVLGTFCLVASGVAHSAESPTSPQLARSTSADGSKSGQKNKKKKKKKSQQASKTESKEDLAQDSSYDDGEAKAFDPDAAEAKDSAAQAEPKPKRASYLFPDWPRRDWNWRLAPIFDYAYGSHTDGESTVRTATSEAGLGAGVREVPLVPGNPGIAFGANAGYAAGSTASTVEVDGDQDTETVRYQRLYGGPELVVYYRYLRDQISWTRGRINYFNDEKDVVQSSHVENDVGVLVLSWLSGHYTFGYLRGYASDYDEPLVIEKDHWLHARMAFDLLDFQLDLGPGTTNVTEYVETESGDTSQVADGRLDDVRLLTAANLFWRIDVSGQARYIYNSTEDDLGTYAGARLPEQGLHEPSTLAMPEDSFTGAAFIGIADLFYGLGIGWRYDIQILNLGRHGGKERVTTKSQGFGVSFHASI